MLSKLSKIIFSSQYTLSCPT